MKIGDSFAIRTSSTCKIATSGEVRGVANRAVFIFLRHTQKVERFAASGGGRTYYTANCTLYFCPTSDSLPPKL